MDIEGFLWFDEIVDKILRKHHVAPKEIEEVFYDKPKYRFAEEGDYRGEDLYIAFGRTDSGRYLTVFFIYKQDHRALILSARDMTRKERRSYETK